MNEPKIICQHKLNLKNNIGRREIIAEKFVQYGTFLFYMRVCVYACVHTCARVCRYTCVWFKSGFYIEKKWHLSFWIWLISLNIGISSSTCSLHMTYFVLFCGWIKLCSVCVSRCRYPFDQLMGAEADSVPCSFEYCCSKCGCDGVSVCAGLASCEQMPKSGPAGSHASSLLRLLKKLHANFHSD